MEKEVSAYKITKLSPGDNLKKVFTSENIDEAIEIFRHNYELLEQIRRMVFDDEGRGIEYEIHIMRVPPYTITINITKEF
jgi:hypothetical protein